MTVELLTRLQERAVSLVETSKQQRKSLDLAVSRVTHTLDKTPDRPLDIKSRCFEVCTRGPHCGRRGGDEVLKKLEVLTADLEGASVEASDCLRHCGQGPNVRLDGVVYSSMTPEKAEGLLQHLRETDKLPVEILLTQSNEDDFLMFELARSNLFLSVQEMSTLAIELEASISTRSRCLPAEREPRMIAMCSILEAVKLERRLRDELDEAQNKLGSVVPLDVFVETIFTRRLEAWAKKQK